jgi:hypothetical protein
MSHVESTEEGRCPAISGGGESGATFFFMYSSIVLDRINDHSSSSSSTNSLFQSQLTEIEATKDMKL